MSVCDGCRLSRLQVENYRPPESTAQPSITPCYCRHDANAENSTLTGDVLKLQQTAAKHPPRTYRECVATSYAVFVPSVHEIHVDFYLLSDSRKLAEDAKCYLLMFSWFVRGSVAEWLLCVLDLGAEGPGSNRSRDAVW